MTEPLLNPARLAALAGWGLAILLGLLLLTRPQVTRYQIQEVPVTGPTTTAVRTLEPAPTPVPYPSCSQLLEKVNKQSETIWDLVDKAGLLITDSTSQADLAKI